MVCIGTDVWELDASGARLQLQVERETAQEGCEQRAKKTDKDEASDDGVADVWIERDGGATVENGSAGQDQKSMAPIEGSHVLAMFDAD